MIRLDRFLSVADFERAARRRLPRLVHEFVAGGTEDSVSLRANREAFETLMFRPRGLSGVAGVSQSVELWGRRYASPIGVAPMGVTAICRHECELALARAAQAAELPFILSGASTMPMEQLQRETPGIWYQGYFPGDTARLGRILQRLQRAAVDVLVVTCDTPVAGNRENNLRNGFLIPFRPSARLAWDGMLHPRWLVDVLARTLLTSGVPRFTNLYEEIGPAITEEPAQGFRGGRELLTWEHLSWLRERWPGRLVVKGILHPADAREAAARKLDGVIVSNHGGRQLDGAMAPLLALPAIKAAVPADFPLMIDGGFRRGADVLKAVALGARIVFLGRPMLYGATIAGQAGVGRVIDILKAEIQRNLSLLGTADIRNVGAGLLQPGRCLSSPISPP
nr:alpha-hydroxy acid oxidase [Ramlibacter sp.]